MLTERQTTLEVLRHIIEIDHRKLYLGRGYASLYEYCTRHLGYSESASFRPIQTARCVRDFPEVCDMLFKNELNVTTVSKPAGILTDENKKALLEEARCKSTRQVEAIVANYNPRRAIRDRVRPVFIKTFQETTETESEPKVDNLKNDYVQDKQSNQKNFSSENWGKFTFGAGVKKLPLAVTLVRENLPSVRDKVFARDKGRCTYIGVNGARCNSSWNLHIDHIKPFAKGGDHSMLNFKLLCARHNQYEAERIYSEEFINRQKHNFPESTKTNETI